MQIGVNYPWRDYGWDFGLAPPAWRERDTRPRWSDEIDRDLQHFLDLGITVVRWFILGDGLAYGAEADAPAQGPDGAWTFDPPPIRPECVDHFEDLLRRFRAAGARGGRAVQLLPVFVDFHFGKTGRPVAPGWIKRGRADAIIDPLKRQRFFDSALEPLLQVSRAYPDAIYAWELINEPEWITFGWHPHWWRTPPVDETSMRTFLEDGCERVRRAGFEATVGFALRKTWLHAGLAGAIGQYHHYPGGRRALAPSPSPGTSPTILGEFATSPRDTWPELPEEEQRVLNRLRLAADRGYSLALPWSFRSTDRYTAWSAEVERDLARWRGCCYQHERPA
jgi:hypothetical protein